MRPGLNRRAVSLLPGYDSVDPLIQSQRKNLWSHGRLSIRSRLGCELAHLMCLDRDIVEWFWRKSLRDERRMYGLPAKNAQRHLADVRGNGKPALILSYAKLHFGFEVRGS